MDFVLYTISVRGIFSTHFEIYRNDVLMYRVRKPSFFAFRKMYFYDTGGNEVLEIYRHASFMKYRMTINQDGKSIATFEKDSFENFYTSTSIYGNYTIEGDFFGREYTVYDDEKDIAKVSRKRFRSKKKYGIAIIEGHNELYILAMVIAIAIINSRRRKKG